MPLGGGKLVFLGASGGKSLSTTIRSLDYERSSSQALSMTPANYGSYSGTKMAVSVWYKRESTGSFMSFIQFRGDMDFFINIQDVDKLHVNCAYSGTHLILVTTATFTDTTSWHHIYVEIDSTQATASDRASLYHDGTKITSFGTETYPDLDDVPIGGAGTLYWVGGRSTGGSVYDGLMFDLATFKTTLPGIDAVYSGGSPPNITSLTGLHSHVNLNGGTTVEDDGVIATNWTNNNTVVASTTTP